MKLRILPEDGDGRPYGTLTVGEDGFEHELTEDAPEEVARLIEESAEWTTRKVGGAPSESACGGVGPEVPMSDRRRVVELAYRLTREAPVRIEMKG